MYSSKILEALKKAKVEEGDLIQMMPKNISGIIMPNTEFNDPDILVLKLSSGYNIGIEFLASTKIKLLQKGRPIELKHAELQYEHQQNMPNISILGAGGTIASRIEYTTGAVFPAFTPGDMVHSFPELKNIANINGRALFNLWSEDIAPEHWKLMAREVAKEIKNGVDGVVLMHGTDTMHYTSAALSFMLQNLPVPVILVGSQRSSDRPSSDNRLNLECAAWAATQDIAEVGICMHASFSDDFCWLHRGTRVRKMHTSRRDAFQSINAKPLAEIHYPAKKLIPLSSFNKKDKTKKLNLIDKASDNVALIYVYPGIKPKILSSLSDYDGIVLASTALGQIPTNPKNDPLAHSLVPAVTGLVNSGIPVVLASQSLYGRINLNVYNAGRITQGTGVIGNYCDWLPEIAFAKLSWVLGQTKKMDKIREMMLTNYSGEISDRSEYDELG